MLHRTRHRATQGALLRCRVPHMPPRKSPFRPASSPSRYRSVPTRAQRNPRSLNVRYAKRLPRYAYQFGCTTLDSHSSPRRHSPSCWRLDGGYAGTVPRLLGFRAALVMCCGDWVDRLLRSSIAALSPPPFQEAMVGAARIGRALPVQGCAASPLSTADPRHRRKVWSRNVQYNAGCADRRHDGGFRVAIVALLADIAEHKD